MKLHYKIIDNETTSKLDSVIQMDILDSDLSDASSDGYKSEAFMIDEVNSEQTDLSDIGLCSLNKNEVQYNMVLCLIKQKKLRRALKLSKELLEHCPKKYAKDVLRLRSILKKWLKNVESKDGENELQLIEPFPVQNRLCKYFPWIRFKNENEKGP